MKAVLQENLVHPELGAALPGTCLSPACGLSSEARQERYVPVPPGGVDRFCLGGMGSLTVNVSSRDAPSSLLGGSGARQQRGIGGVG